jgi:hypothetical protein
MAATETVILAGEIFLHGSGGEGGASSSVDGQPVGFFKMISAPSDIKDSVDNLDKRIVTKHF